jgi:hypothetical protein
MKFKTVTPRPIHEAARLEMVNALRKHGDDLTPVEVLAIAAQVVGQLIALQDQTKITPEDAMTLVAENLQLGNQTVLDGLINTVGNG